MAMRLLFDAATGEIAYAVPDAEVFYFPYAEGMTLDTFEIDEVGPDNKDLCTELRHKYAYTNLAGERKYHMINNAGTWELHSRDGWVIWARG